MDALDKQIKSYFEREVSLLPRESRRMAPSTEDFYRFVTDALEGKALDDFLDYLKAAPEAQKMVARARVLMDDEEDAEKEKAPADWVRDAKALFFKSPVARCPHCGKQITPFKRPVKRQNIYNFLWLLSSAISFLASFFYRRYFYQCLALALFFGIKWILDRRVTKTQILIYKALTGEQSSTHSRDLHKSSSHL